MQIVGQSGVTHRLPVTINGLAQWQAGVNYIPDDFVTYNGAIYLSLTNNIASQPDLNPLDWALYPLASGYLREVFAPINGQTVFTLSQNATSPANSQMRIHGQDIIYGTDYNIVGTTVTYTSTSYIINAGDIIEVFYY